jgi:hypothetical protein
MAPPDDITRLYQACDPSQPLEPDDPRYVNCDDVRGNNIVQKIARGIRRAGSKDPLVRPFAGHRGVGKTSELNRLRAELQRPVGQGGPASAPEFQVIQFDVTDTLDVNDLDFPDLLVLIAAEAQQQLRDANIPGFGAVTTWLQRLWDDVKGLLGMEVNLKEACIKDVVPFAELKLEFRNRPNGRAKLREKIEQLTTGLLGAINDLLTAAQAALEKEGRNGLVLIIDGLDKVVRRALPNGSNTHERLFVERAEQLASLKAHVVMTMPISLFYAVHCADVEQTFGAANVPVSMISLRGPNRAAPAPDAPGIKKMWEILEARCAFAKVAPEKVFDDRKTGQLLLEMTGGHPRHLSLFMRSAMDELDALPITRPAVEMAVRNYANSLMREIPEEFWPKLRAYAGPRDEIPKDEIHQQMLFLLHLFEYTDHRPWYEVNPVLRTLPKFAGP